MNRLPAWREHLDDAYLADLRAHPVIGPLVDGNRRTSKIIGTVRERYFFRQSAGPGWALVGDAGHHKDPHIGDGITDALLQAKELAAAITEGGTEPLERYWRQRDVDYYELFRFAQDQGDPRPVTALDRVFMEHVRQSAELQQRMGMAFEREISPYDLVSPKAMLGWVGRGALSGAPGLIAQFLSQGRRINTIKKELAGLKKARRALDPVG